MANWGQVKNAEMDEEKGDFSKVYADSAECHLFPVIKVTVLFLVQKRGDTLTNENLCLFYEGIFMP